MQKQKNGDKEVELKYNKFEESSKDHQISDIGLQTKGEETGYENGHIRIAEQQHSQSQIKSLSNMRTTWLIVPTEFQFQVDRIRSIEGKPNMVFLGNIFLLTSSLLCLIVYIELCSHMKDKIESQGSKLLIHHAPVLSAGAFSVYLGLKIHKEGGKFQAMTLNFASILGAAILCLVSSYFDKIEVISSAAICTLILGGFLIGAGLSSFLMHLNIAMWSDKSNVGFLMAAFQAVSFMFIAFFYLIANLLEGMYGSTLAYLFSLASALILSFIAYVNIQDSPYHQLSSHTQESVASKISSWLGQQIIPTHNIFKNDSTRSNDSHQINIDNMYKQCSKKHKNIAIVFAFATNFAFYFQIVYNDIKFEDVDFGFEMFIFLLLTSFMRLCLGYFVDKIDTGKITLYSLGLAVVGLILSCFSSVETIGSLFAFVGFLSSITAIQKWVFQITYHDAVSVMSAAQGLGFLMAIWFNIFKKHEILIAIPYICIIISMVGVYYTQRQENLQQEQFYADIIQNQTQPLELEGGEDGGANLQNVQKYEI